MRGWGYGFRDGLRGLPGLALGERETLRGATRVDGGRGKLLLWRERDALVCEIQDEGHIEDPLIGRSPPAPNQHTGTDSAFRSVAAGTVTS